MTPSVHLPGLYGGFTTCPDLSWVTLFTLLFDSAGCLFECKNSFVNVRGLLCGYSRSKEIYGGFYTIYSIYTVF